MSLPRVRRVQLRWFAGYVRWFLQRNFHGLQLLALGRMEALGERALLVCVNHPSWWDPLLALYLSQRLFPGRVQYAPIAAAGLEKYKFFENLGFFGIDPKSRAGAARFLAVGDAVLSRRDGAFWVTVQGHFKDVRERPFRIEPGVGHLAFRARNVVMLPVAFEYAFWNERYPEAFACVGEAIEINDGAQCSAREWCATFSAALERTQDTLSKAVIARNPAKFEPLLHGSAGIGGVYDVWRALKARLQGRRFAPGHGRI